MQVDTVLVPVDGTERAIDAVEYAVAIADRYEAGVHALYLIGEDAAAAIRDGRIETAAVVERCERVMACVQTIASEVPVDHSSACGFSVDRLAVHPGSVILDVAELLDADFVVIPRTSIANESDVFLEKAAEYVLAYASQPVLSV